MAKKIHTLMKARETETIVFESVRHSLSEMHKLLESYAPLWYTEEVHDRAGGALSQLRQFLRSNRVYHLHKGHGRSNTKQLRSHRKVA